MKEKAASLQPTCLMMLRFTAWLMTAVALLWLANQSVAQESMPIHPDYIYPEFDKERSEMSREEKAEAKKAVDKVKLAIRKGSDAVKDNAKAGSANFGPDGDKFIENYMLARMTQTDSETLGKLGSMRTSFLDTVIPKSSQSPYRREVIQKILPMMLKVAKNQEFHPAVRANVVAAIGMLDTDAGSSSIPPTPSTAAYNALKNLYTDATEVYIKVEALSGIRRFAELSRRLGATTPLGADLQTSFTAIINGTETGQDKWSDDLDYWIKRRATQTLGYVARGNDLVSTATKVMKGENLDIKRDQFWLRYDGLQALKNIDFSELDQAKTEQLIDDVLEFTAYALDRESSWLKANVDDLVYRNIFWNDVDLENSRRRSGGDGGGRGGGGSGLGGPSGKGGGGGGTGAFDPPGGGRDGGGRGGPGGSFRDKDRKEPPKVELPVFMLNDSRARIKIVLITARNFFRRDKSGSDTPKGIVAAASGANADRINNEILPTIDQLIKDTDIGVIDYKKLKGAEPDNEDVTFRLQEAYAKGGSKVRALMENPVADKADEEGFN